MKALRLVQGLPCFAERADAGVVEVSSDADTPVNHAHLLDWLVDGSSSALGVPPRCCTDSSSSLDPLRCWLPGRGAPRAAEKARF
jgi:hypothetical protein